MNVNESAAASTKEVLYRMLTNMKSSDEYYYEKKRQLRLFFLQDYLALIMSTASGTGTTG
jgi:hypothetical protein